MSSPWNKKKTAINWYKYHLESVFDVTMPWDLYINTDRTLKSYRADVIINDRNENVCILIGMSVPSVGF